MKLSFVLLNECKITILCANTQTILTIFPTLSVFFDLCQTIYGFAKHVV